MINNVQTFLVGAIIIMTGGCLCTFAIFGYHNLHQHKKSERLQFEPLVEEEMWVKFSLCGRYMQKLFTMN